MVKQVHGCKHKLSHMFGTISEYLPVICEWRRSEHELSRRTVVHLKVVDPDNAKYDEPESDSRLKQGWLKYGDPQEKSAIAKCEGNRKLVGLLVCATSSSTQ